MRRNLLIDDVLYAAEWLVMVHVSDITLGHGQRRVGRKAELLSGSNQAKV
jgi:hypothetical protein